MVNLRRGVTVEVVAHLRLCCVQNRVLLKGQSKAPHDSHSSQALSLQDRGQASRVTTAPYHVLPQVWQVYDSQGHGEAV